MGITVAILMEAGDVVTAKLDQLGDVRRCGEMMQYQKLAEVLWSTTYNTTL
ncbi:hypothetical protein [Polycladomyces subterraneus]|uniref:Uncharacterized protein n=1 Tax=Polycladomyces subterraneus TaxID=1016997 RepID=A0ABT8IJY8_9BACL|nr:hypothetical protein [Polycladomyces subterraneus]MDN4593097.1 hypothetical protein [Polycladomyces subterraneus]